MNLFDITGKVAIVTGGNGGIGLGMAKGMASIGASILVAGRNADKAGAAVAALRTIGGEAEFFQVDVTQQDQCIAMVEEAQRIFGRVDILVNNAGISIRKRPEELSEAEWHQVIDTNLTSAFLCCKAVYTSMKAVGGGKIINIGSMMSLFGTSYASPYASSKGGIVQMTRSFASAWAADNIQVNAILPGWIDTELTRVARTQVDQLHASVLARTPAGRWGTPDDLAGIAAFLAAPASDFVTGAAIPVDGGVSVQG